MIPEENSELYADNIVIIFQRMEATALFDTIERLRNAEPWLQDLAQFIAKLKKEGASPYSIRIKASRYLRQKADYQEWVRKQARENLRVIQHEQKAARKRLRDTVMEIIVVLGDFAFMEDEKLWEVAHKKLHKKAVSGIIKDYGTRVRDRLLETTKTTVFGAGNSPAKRVFTDTLNRAVMKAASEFQPPKEAIETAARELASAGMSAIHPESGKIIKADTVARLTVQGLTNQMAGDITQKNCEDTGTEYVEVSAHWGARPSHSLWQGKVYSMKEFIEVCGYGKVPMTEDQIYSWNCRHTHYPFFPGISKPMKPLPPEPPPTEWKGKKYTYYEATQKQRSYERRIRELKRMKKAGIEIPRGAITRLMDEYKAFSAACGLSVKYARCRYLGVL